MSNVFLSLLLAALFLGGFLLRSRSLLGSFLRGGLCRSRGFGLLAAKSLFPACGKFSIRTNANNRHNPPRSLIWAANRPLWTAQSVLHYALTSCGVKLECAADCKVAKAVRLWIPLVGLCQRFSHASSSIFPRFWRETIWQRAGEICYTKGAYLAPENVFRVSPMRKLFACHFRPS